MRSGSRTWKPEYLRRGLARGMPTINKEVASISYIVVLKDFMSTIQASSSPQTEKPQPPARAATVLKPEAKEVFFRCGTRNGIGSAQALGLPQLLAPLVAHTGRIFHAQSRIAVSESLE